MLDLAKLATQYEMSLSDKSDLFDFYHNNWEGVIAALAQYQKHLSMRMPPWTCPRCEKDTVVDFRYMEHNNMIRSTCAACGEISYSSTPKTAPML